MAHIEIINKIIDAEKNAREIAGDAKERLARFDTDLSAEYESLRSSYIARAEHRIGEVIKNEKAYADEIIAKLDDELSEALKASGETAAKNREAWADKLFHKVIDIPEIRSRH